MNIKDIVRKHLIEAKMSNETGAFLLNKWKGASPEAIQKIFDWFESIKSTLPLDPDKIKGGLLSFLGWYNGSSPNREKFELKNIRDIRSYSLPQIKRLWSELKTEPLDTGEDESVKLSVDPIFYQKVDNASPSHETIVTFTKDPNNPKVSENERKTLNELYQKSKELWYGTRHLIFENDGFRVYNIPDQATSIAFGWFLYYIRYTYNYNGSNWCTTYPNSNNQFRSKRDDRSFYFIIDESKFPPTTENRNQPEMDGPNFFLSALQIMSPTNYQRAQYKVTGIHNPGEPVFDSENLLKLYPKLGSLLGTDKLKYTAWSEDERIKKDGTDDPISRINEREGNEYEFAVRPPNEKIEYINRRGYVLRRSRSWNSMTEAMKKQYSFATLTEDNMFDKFSNSELFKALSQAERNTLNQKIEILKPGEGGIKLIINNIMKNDFYVDARLSLNKDYLSLYKSRTTSKYGIYNLKEDNWVNHNGIIYDDEYTEISHKPYKTKDGKRYYIITFSRSSTPNQTSFYVAVPVTDNIDGYFISAAKWEELKLQLVRDENPENTNVDYDPETDDTDITENRYEN